MFDFWGIPMKTLLITGFTPFPGAPENPTAELVGWAKEGLLNVPEGWQLVALLLETEYEKSIADLESALTRLKPQALIEFGLSAKAVGFTLEKVARNEITARQPDNKGAGSTAGPINETGPDTLPTGLPVQDIFKVLKNADLSVGLSDDAGGYVCNHLFYRTRNSTNPARPKTSGFIHIPYLEPQRDRLAAKGEIKPGLAALSEADLIRGVELILEVVAEGA